MSAEANTASVASLLADLERQGVELWFEGDRLRFRAPKGALTPEQRAALVAQKAEVLAHLRAAAATQEKTFPLSFSQQSLWFLHHQAPGSTAYHVALSARVLSKIDAGALRNAVQGLVDRHASLRTTYAFAGGAPCQRVRGAAKVAFDVHAIAPGSTDAELRAAVEADYRRPFDLEHGPVLRASLYDRGPEDHVLLVTVHHIAADGWSLMILFDEMLKLYAEGTGGPAAGLARSTLAYSDYSAWQADALDGAEGERLWAYWREKLAPPIGKLDLPLDRPRPATQTFRGASLPMKLSPELSERLRVLARDEGTTLFVLLLASLQAFLFRLTAADDVIVGTPTFARSKAEFMRVVGDFVNSVPLRSRPASGLTFRALLAQTRRTVLEALDAQEFPMSLLVQRLQPERDSSRSPLFDTFFILQRFDQFKDLQGLLAGSEDDPPIEAGGLRLAGYPLDQQEGQFDLALQMVEQGGVLHAVFKYATDLFDPGTVTRFASDYVALVEVIVRDPEVTLGALPTPAGAVKETLGALLERLRAADIRLVLDGEKLKVNAPKGAMTDDLKRAIGERRAQLVETLRASADGAGALGAGATLVRIPRVAPLPVSSAQQRLWFLDRMDPGRSHYNVGGMLRITGAVDAALMRRAVDELVERHESLRTCIVEHEGAPAVEIRDAARAPLEFVDLSHLSPDAARTEGDRKSGERLRAPFDVARGPLAGFVLVRVTPDEHLLTMAIHHVVADGWSMLIAFREIFRVYERLQSGLAPDLPPLRLQYVDYAAWERDQLNSGQMGRHLGYWKRELAGAPAVLDLPTDRPRPAAASMRGHRVTQYFDTALIESVKQVGRQHEATLFMTLLAAFQVLLHRYSGQEDIVVGTPAANRDQPALEGIIGCFVNNLVLRARLGENPTFTELLAQVKQTTLGAFDHRDLPFDVLVDGLRPERSSNHAPVFQVLLTLQSYLTQIPAPPGLAIAFADPPDLGVARFDLTLELAEYDGKFGALYEYASDLFDRETILRMHGQLARLLAGIVRDPARRVQELPLLGAEDERLLLGAWNDTTVEHDRTRCVHQLFEAVARATPDAVAAVAGSVSLTYRALDERANQLAHLLRARGVVPGDLVAICLDRTVDMPIALAAVLKTGAAYVPLDPTHPADRLRYTLEDAGVSAVVTLARFAALVADAGAPAILVDEAAAELAALPTTPPAVTVAPEDRAYVIYTSGSTGRPKGVEVEHRNVVAFLEAMRRAPGFTATDRLLAVTTLSFDIAGLEFWLPLSTGARVVIASRTDVLDGERLMAMLEDDGITVLQATPATFRLMLDAGWSGKRGLKVLCGGEALPRDLSILLTERVGELWNMYGPTETTIWSTTSRIDDPAAPITVGRPIHNTRVYILERSGQPAPIGVPGELCIAGEGVARGYRNRPELTAEKFVTLTLPDGRSERVYRTGDVARFRGDGQIDFLGRRDHQVKVRGYRIELGEIESVLAAHPGVKECVVSAREDTPGDARLVGYVVPVSGTPFDVETARATLRAKLPEYMVPNLFVTLAALPLTPNGKIDRKALPAPQAAVAKVDDEGEVLMAPTQRRVAGAWREVLRIDRVGLYDNFFDIGGHSLLLVKLHAALKREFASDIKLVELFQWTTVAGQAALLSATAPNDDAVRRAQARAARQADG